jgi:hypothetical protein
MNRYFIAMILILFLLVPVRCLTQTTVPSRPAEGTDSIVRFQPNELRHDRDGRDYFVDCGVVGADGDGYSSASPWHTVNAVNEHTFSPGDVIRLKRGTECHGALWPKGSGSEAAIVRLTAYGEGVRPRVTAKKGDEQAFKLFNQEYWDVDSIDFSGGTTYGIFVSGDAGILHHIHLGNLLVHGVYGGSLKSKDSGLVVISPGKPEQRFDDVLVEGITAYHTNQWAGILIGGGNFGFLPESAWSTRVVVRNSVVHDLYGDGIVLFRVRNGRIDTSAAWHTGMQPTETTGTPNAIWTWMCTDCVVSQNEAFLTDSPGVDGGAFDIDYGNTRNSVLDNYGHDTQGYCVSIFGAGYVTHESVVEGNLCLNNGKSPRLAFYQGAIFLWTWNNGIIENLRVERNTIYWEPPGMAPALINHADLRGSQRVFRENHIYSNSPWMVDSNREMLFQNNRYTSCELDAAKWVFENRTYNSLDEFRVATGQDQGSTWSAANANIPCSGLERPQREDGSGSAAISRATDGHDPVTSGWRVLSEMSGSIGTDGLLDASSAGQLRILKTLYAQFRASGLQMIITLHLQESNSDQSLQNVIRDLGMGDIKVAVSSDGDSFNKPTTSLVGPDGLTVIEWHGFVGPAKVGLAVRRRLGKPFYSQLEPEP